MRTPTDPTPETADDTKDVQRFVGRAARRSLGIRSTKRPFRRPRAVPHPLASFAMGGRVKVTAEDIEGRTQRLRVAYERTRAAGEMWVEPADEQAHRDRRAARARARAGRRASRSRR